MCRPALTARTIRVFGSNQLAPRRFDPAILPTAPISQAVGCLLSLALSDPLASHRCRQMRTGKLVAWKRKRLVTNRLANPTRSNALGTHPHRLDLTARQRSLDVLQIRKETTAGNTRDLRTDTTQVLRLTTGFDHIANLGRLSANFTSSCHDRTRFSETNERDVA